MTTPAGDVIEFNARIFAESFKPWTYTARGGRKFTARHVSVLAVQDYLLSTHDAPPPTHARALRRLMRLAFPWRPTFLLFDPVSVVCDGLPLPVRKAAVADFLAAPGEPLGWPVHPAQAGIEIELFFGSDWYRGSHHRWPTKDGSLPFRCLFAYWRLLRQPIKRAFIARDTS